MQAAAVPAEVSAAALQGTMQVHQLVQAMNVFDAGEQGIDLNSMTEPYLQKEHLLASGLSHAHAA